MRNEISTAAFRFDAAVFHWIIAHRVPLLNPVFSGLSHFGAFVWLGFALAIGALRRCRWSGVYQAALGIGLAVLLANALAKPFVERHRPYVEFPDVVLLAGVQRSTSFPSTHSASAFAGAYALSRAFPQFSAVLWLLAGLVAASRVYVGVHFPLDAIGGAAIGVLAAAFVTADTRWKSV